MMKQSVYSVKLLKPPGNFIQIFFWNECNKCIGHCVSCSLIGVLRKKFPRNLKHHLVSLILISFMSLLLQESISITEIFVTV